MRRLGVRQVEDVDLLRRANEGCVSGREEGGKGADRGAGADVVDQDDTALGRGREGGEEHGAQVGGVAGLGEEGFAAAWGKDVRGEGQEACVAVGGWGGGECVVEVAVWSGRGKKG